MSRKFFNTAVVLVNFISLSFSQTLSADSVEVLLNNRYKAHELNLEGISLLQKNEIPDAREKFEKAQNLDPDSPEYLNNIGYTFLVVNDLEKAELLFIRSLEVDPNFFRANFNLGVVSQKKSNYHKAIGYYKKAAENNITFPEARYNLALMYMRIGERKLAIESFEKFIQIATPEMKQAVKDARQRITEINQGE